MTLCEDIPYINARIRGRKSRLLGLERLRSLARLPSVEELIQGLADTPYASDISRATASEPAHHRAAELALGQNLAQDFSRVRRFTPGIGESPARYLFSCWDLRNLKAVLRGVHAREAPERTGSVCTPGGWVPAPVWAELARSATLEEAVERSISMDLGFREALREGWAAYRKTQLVASLDARLDRQFFGNALNALESLRGAFWNPLEDLIRFDIDARNLSALLEWLHRGERPGRELLIPGGRWTGEPFVRELSIHEDVRETVRQCLLRWIKNAGVEIAHFLEIGQLNVALEILERKAWMLRARRLQGSPLSLDLPIGYIWAKAAEVADLRRAVWGIYLGAPPGWVESGFLTE